METAYAGILNTGTLTLGNSSVDGNSTTGDQARAVGGISSSGHGLATEQQRERE